MEFARAPLPVLDPHEMAAEKIAAFWRCQAACDLYDLDHLGRVLQADFDGPAIAELAASTASTITTPPMISSRATTGHQATNWTAAMMRTNSLNPSPDLEY